MSLTSADPRGALLAFIREFPGLHLRELARQCGLSEPLASYHLKNLLRQRTIVSELDQPYRRFFVRGGRSLEKKDRATLIVLRHPESRRVALLLLKRARAAHGQIADALGWSKSLASYHLSKLEERGFIRRVDGREFVLTHPAHVERLMLRWRPLDGLAVRAAQAWSQLYDRRKGRG